MYNKLHHILSNNPKAWPKLVLQNKFKQEISFQLNRKDNVIWVCNNKKKDAGKLCYARIEVNQSALSAKVYFFKSCPSNTQLGINHLLAIYLENPSLYAKQYGDAEHKCMYCNHPLTNAESIYHGYGPICAANFSLPYGDAIKDAKLAIKVSAIKKQNKQTEMEI